MSALFSSGSDPAHESYFDAWEHNDLHVELKKKKENNNPSLREYFKVLWKQIYILGAL